METTLEAKPMSRKQREAHEQRGWVDKLRGILKPGDTVDCVLRHVSRSGMRRRIDLYARTPDGPMFISGMAAAAMGDRWDRDRGGIIVGGCGMDMGFHLVYNLSYTLWPNGFGCIGEKCRSNDHDHSNGDRDYTPHCTQHPNIEHDACSIARPGCQADHWHKDGGYALRHNWL